MRNGLMAAFAALLSCTTVAAADPSEMHRLYDRRADCAVFETAGSPAESVSWDGPCIHGLAAGHGTAKFFGVNGASETVTADFSDGVIDDGKGEIGWSDGSHYSGELSGGKPDGAGTMIDAEGNRFTGEWRDGAMNGHGTVLWTNGDRFEGELVDGKAEGRGVQTWADGHKYDGTWHNDRPDGQGIVTRKDGTQYSAIFVDGKQQPAAAQVAAAPPPSAAPVASAAPAIVPAVSHKLLDAYVGHTLFGVDRSSVTLESQEAGVVLTITAPDGQTRRMLYTVVGDGIGTIADAGAPAQVLGFFKIRGGAIEAEYSDGHRERLEPTADGLALTLTGDGGAKFCAAWYPDGHVFSAAERKAAVAAYARKLGVDPGPVAAASSSCIATAPARPTSTTTRRRTGRSAQQTAALTPPVPAAIAAAAAQPASVDVKPSIVHAIDGAPGADTLDTAAAAATPMGDETIASRCLKVDSDGTSWGFRNHCSYAVQFAFCLLHDTDPMTACNAEGGVPGSVSANGFGALFADDSLGEHGVEHEFRWIGCRGGAGEVVAHLDQPDPASGRCVRANRALAQGN